MMATTDPPFLPPPTHPGMLTVPELRALLRRALDQEKEELASTIADRILQLEAAQPTRRRL